MLTITNVAKLPADFSVISKDKFLIEPGKYEQLRIVFDMKKSKN